MSTNLCYINRFNEAVAVINMSNVNGFAFRVHVSDELASLELEYRRQVQRSQNEIDDGDRDPGYIEYLKETRDNTAHKHREIHRLLTRWNTVRYDAHAKIDAADTLRIIALVRNYAGQFDVYMEVIAFELVDLIQYGGNPDLYFD